MAKYFIKETNNMRHVLRVESEDELTLTISNPLFTHFGSKFCDYGRKRTITKKWFNRQKGWKPMNQNLSNKYDTIKRGDNTSILFQ